MKRGARIVVVLLGAQALLFVLYMWVEHNRQPIAPQLSTAPPIPIDQPLMELTLRNRADETTRLRAVTRPALLHFWASWCPPCRAELPGLLRLSEDEAIDVIAISVDRDWAAVDPFLRGLPRSDVFLGDATEVRHRLSVSGLPTTFLVEPPGRMRLRFDGARDWSDASFRSEWLGRE